MDTNCPRCGTDNTQDSELALKQGSPDEAIATLKKPISYRPSIIAIDNMSTFMIYSLPCVRRD